MFLKKFEMKGDGDCYFAIPSVFVFHLFHKNNFYAFFPLDIIDSFKCTKWAFKWENYSQKTLYQVFTSTEGNTNKAYFWSGHIA